MHMATVDVKGLTVIQVHYKRQTGHQYKDTMELLLSKA